MPVCTMQRACCTIMSMTREVMRNSARKQTGDWGKFFTASEEMKNILDQISDIEDGFPFETTIVSEVFDGGKVKYKFS